VSSLNKRTPTSDPEACKQTVKIIISAKAQILKATKKHRTADNLTKMPMMNRHTIALALLSLAITKVHAFQVGTTSTRPTSALHDGSEYNDDGRRAFVVSSMAAAAASFLMPSMPAYAEGRVDYKAVATDIMDLVKKNRDWGPSECRECQEF
jgi:hypothetical protein